MSKTELLEIAKPILFNTEMVKAILEMRKTVTRRLIKLRYKDDEGGFSVCTNKKTGRRWVEKHDWDEGGFDNPRYVKLPYHVGDILYVRETWLKADDGIYYKADETPNSKKARTEFGYKWRPSIHMPKEAARIFLEVTDVRVERLQDITEKQAMNEGVSCSYWSPTFNDPDSGGHDPDFVGAFEELWNSTIKKKDMDSYGWEANPWVWVVEFEKLEVE